jgi:5-(carboxyamino)imidazole ribonucleotide synthase
VSLRRVGILGGGQLGRMTIEAARKYPSYIVVLSPDYPSPASDLADEVIVGSLSDREAILDLASRVDVVSYEIEHVNVDALKELEARGVSVIPGASVLELIQDKGRQKTLWDSAAIPQAPWTELPDDLSALFPDAREAILKDAAAKVGGFPVIQKLRRGGYDGKGVRVLACPRDELLPGRSFLEEKIDFAKELAVVLARSADGKTAVYPCVEMVFDPAVNLCDSVLAPARENATILAEAERVARECVEALDRSARTDSPKGAGAVGVFAVELFLTRDGRVLVNEAAPRPHNSGHWTQEACVTSQFDQYYRILAGLPLGSPELLRPAMMMNILGAPDASGPARYEGLAEALALPGVSVHIYGKREVRPFRKMGHLTALGSTTEEAETRASSARALVQAVASK